VSIRRGALLGCYALATFLAFPHPVLGTVVDLGWVAAWLAPLFLILALRGAAPRRALGLGFLGGLVAHTAVLHWIYVVTVTYGHAPPVVGLIAPILLATYIAGFTALFGMSVAWLERRRLASPFAVAAVWTALDHLRSFALTGFPWATLGYAQHQNLALMPLVAWTGVYGLSFLSVLGGAALARLYSSLRLEAESSPASSARRLDWGTWAALGVVVCAHMLGVALNASRAALDWPAVRVAVLQGNIDQAVKWSPEWAGRTLEIYEELTRRAVAEGDGGTRLPRFRSRPARADRRPGRGDRSLPGRGRGGDRWPRCRRRGATAARRLEVLRQRLPARHGRSQPRPVRQDPSGSLWRVHAPPRSARPLRSGDRDRERRPGRHRGEITT
jgi:apolipoprotein N-acyltransferase